MCIRKSPKNLYHMAPSNINRVDFHSRHAENIHAVNGKGTITPYVRRQYKQLCQSVYIYVNAYIYIYVYMHLYAC